ncbi:hypothetical protein [Streptomyces xanthophaeus]
MSVSEMQAEFSRVRAGLHSPRFYDAKGQLDRLEEAALAAVYEENERGGQARGIVAAIADVLAVDIDEGLGHRWDLNHMQRVVVAAQQLRHDRIGWHQELSKHDEERAESRRARADLSRRLREALDQRNVWKESLENMDAKVVQPLRLELEKVQREYDTLRLLRRAEPARMVVHTTAADERRATEAEADVDELKAVIVSQAREIARLKEESK